MHDERMPPRMAAWPPDRSAVDLPVPGIGQHGQAIDVLLSAWRDLAAAQRFSIRALRSGATARPRLG
jgi:hypothetical protein